MATMATEIPRQICVREATGQDLVFDFEETDTKIELVNFDSSKPAYVSMMWITGNYNSVLKLDVSVNRFRSLPKGFVQLMPNLEVIVFEYSLLESITDEMFSGMPRLKSIKVTTGSSGIADISYQSFKGCPSLKILLLNQNRISNLPVEVFQDCPLLMELNLSENKIRSLPVCSLVRVEEFKDFESS